ncbi:50S ribosomal protein L17 [Candidatus Giovannonibacteria bacterium]|nr:50S ribosomal protein L17 [Candidatus Giovannonibacteria bacterium]
MRHRKKGRKFGRVRKVRKAFLRSLLRALVLKERIRTTEARAKEIRPRVEKLVTLAKKNTLAARRLVAARLDRDSAKKIFSVIAPRYEKRPGGYTRIIKLPPRSSDRAKMAIIEFVK